MRNSGEPCFGLSDTNDRLRLTFLSHLASSSLITEE
jgi:hypothetical protein